MAILGPTPAASAPQICKNTYGGDLIYAREMKCKTARQIVRSWAEGYKQDGITDRTVSGFRCSGRNDSIEGLVVSCVRGKKKVRFFANVP